MGLPHFLSNFWHIWWLFKVSHLKATSVALHVGKPSNMPKIWQKKALCSTWLLNPFLHGTYKIQKPKLGFWVPDLSLIHIGTKLSHFYVGIHSFCNLIYVATSTDIEKFKRMFTIRFEWCDSIFEYFKFQMVYRRWQSIQIWTYQIPTYLPMQVIDAVLEKNWHLCL